MTKAVEPVRLPTAADVDAAAQRLKGVALHTPLISSPVLDALTGGIVFLQGVTLLRTEFVKIRLPANNGSFRPLDPRVARVFPFSLWPSTHDPVTSCHPV